MIGDYLPTPPAWTADALCAQTDPEAFYPDQGGSTKEARAVCAKCTVRAECLTYALAIEADQHWYRWGVWGGLDARERRKLAKQHGDAA